MSEIPSEIQCYRDSEKICPLRQAVAEAGEHYARPPEERTTVEDSYARLAEIAEPLSWADRRRYYSLLGGDFGKSEFTGECLLGPRKDFLLFGKIVCDAETEYHDFFEPAAINKQ